MEQPDKPSEFGRALSGSGYEFEAIAQLQHEGFKDARRKFVSCLAAGMIMLATTGNTVAKHRNDGLFLAEFAVDGAAAGFFLEMSRRQIKQARLMRLEEQNTKVLVEIIRSARDPQGRDT